MDYCTNNRQVAGDGDEDQWGMMGHCCWDGLGTGTTSLWVDEGLQCVSFMSISNCHSCV